MSTKRPFEQIVIQHGPTVLRVCRALLARSDADDAWSETFLAALRAYPELPPDANVQAWLVTIAHRKAIDALRAEARRPRPVAVPPEPPGPPSVEDTDDGPAVGRMAGPAGQATPGRRPAPHRRTAVRGGRRAPWRHRRGRPPGRRRRHRGPAPHLPSHDDDHYGATLMIDKPTAAELIPATDPADARPAAPAAGRRGRRRRVPGRRLPDGRLAAGPAAAGRDRAGPGPAGLRAGGPRPRAAGAGRPRSARGSCAHPAGSTRSPASWTTTSPDPGDLRPPGGSSAVGRLSSAGAGPPATIGYGQTETYTAVAVAAGRPRAVRAVGSACATNPMPVVVPCHRVLRTDGTLGGYVGGLRAKRTLLALER